MADTAITCESAGTDPHSISRQGAVQAILSRTRALHDTQTVPLKAAFGRTLAHDYHAQHDVPPHRASAMDGYALNARDALEAGATLHVAGSAFAGHPYPHTLKAGEAVKITTGGVVPEGADAVVMKEYVQSDALRIVLQASVQPQQFVRPQGSDVQRGQTLMHQGHRLDAAALALLASDGCETITVLRPTRVAIFSSGDELREPGSGKQAGQIYDANRYALSGLLQAQGCEVIDLGIIPDQAHETRATIETAKQQADVVISTGGVSVGESDFIRPVLADYGELAFWKVAVKPGKPLSMARLGDALYFGLPGNPVSTIVSFQLFVLPALQALQQQAVSEPVFRQARLSESLKKQAGREEFQRGLLSQDAQGELWVSSAGLQDSHALHGLVNGNCYIHLASETTGATAGSLVDVLPFEQIGQVVPLKASTLMT